MENKFQCPPAFDVNAARVYLISPRFKDECAGIADVSVMPLNGKQRPAYLSTMGKVWKEISLPGDVLFEEVAHNCDVGGNYLKHFHTEFNLMGHTVHIDYVHAWSYGSGTGQTQVKIYVDGTLEASAIRGGGSLGGNWLRRWPASVIVGELLLRFREDLNFEKGKLLFKPGDDDSPVVQYESVPPEAVPFHLFNLTSEIYIERRLIPALRVDLIDHVFHKGAADNDKSRFLSKLLARGRGHFISDEALREMVSLEIFSDCLGFLHKCVFKEKGGSIEGTDFELNEYRTGELTNYFRELLLRVH